MGVEEVRIMKVRVIFGSMTYRIYFLLYISVTMLSQSGKAFLEPRLEILPVFFKESGLFDNKIVANK